MRPMHWLGTVLGIAILSTTTLATVAQDKSAPAEVEVKIVKYAGLGEVIKQNKGKVVIVDFWSLTCLPCRKEFPHLVALHKKYGKEGLVAVSVDLDDPSEEKEVKEKALKFLKEQNATFTNLILDEKAEVWQDKLRFTSVPCIFVFDRQGSRAKKYDDKVDFEEIEKLAVELLKK